MGLRLRSCEESSGVFVLVSPVVIWELVAHLADVDDPAYTHCLNSLVLLGLHAENPASMNGGISIFADAESTVCQELFRVVPEDHQEGIRNLGSLVTYCVKYAPAITDPVVVQNIAMISRVMAATEQGWLVEMNEVLKSFDPELAKAFFGGGSNDREVFRKMRAYFKSESFMNIWAAFLVVKHAAKVGAVIPSPEKLQEMVKAIRATFPVPLHLMIALLEKLATPRPPNLANANRKRWNFVWDTMIAFSVGTDHEINGARILLVTGDGEIIDAAHAAGCGNRVLSLDDYLKSVGAQSLHP